MNHPMIRGLIGGDRSSLAGIDDGDGDGSVFYSPPQPPPPPVPQSVLERVARPARRQFNAARLALRHAGRSLDPSFARVEHVPPLAPPPPVPIPTLEPEPKRPRFVNASHDKTVRNADAWRGDAEQYPNPMLCPILHEPFRDPVLALDGFSYERAAIERWLASALISPIVGAPMCAAVWPNHSLRRAVDEFSTALQYKLENPEPKAGTY